MTSLKTPDLSPEDFVRMLLWDDFPECCGNPVEDTGGEYMGQRETVMSCCGCPEPARLADAQIVASLRERFPEQAQPECPTCGGNGYTNEGDPEIGNAPFDCTTCSGSGRLPAGAVSTLSAVAVAPAVPPAHGELPRHQFWGAGEPDCPPELKAPNGELHTTRCKVCGDGWRKSLNVCLAARQGMPVERVAMLWNSLPLETDPQSVIAFARAIERFHGIGAAGVGVVQTPGMPAKLPAVTTALSLCMAANSEAQLPVPMCWDLALYVQRLEAAVALGVPEAQSLQHATKENGDCPCWCKACATEAAARAVALPAPLGWWTDELEKIFTAKEGSAITADMKRAAHMALTVARGGRWDDEKQEWTHSVPEALPPTREPFRSLLREALEYFSGDSEFIQTCRAALAAGVAPAQPEQENGK